MRTFLALLLLTSIAAAEQEEFTLTDGRKFTGTYDKETQSLYIDPAGKMSLHITPDQIAERKPVKVADKAPEKPEAESMTKEEKEVAMAKFRLAKADAANQELLRQADAKDKEAAECTKKANAATDKITESAKSFVARAKAEGKGYTVKEVMREKIALPKTNASNQAVLDLIDWKKGQEAKAIELRKEAEALRARVPGATKADPTKPDGAKPPVPTPPPGQAAASMPGPVTAPGAPGASGQAPGAYPQPSRP